MQVLWNCIKIGKESIGANREYRRYRALSVKIRTLIERRGKESRIGIRIRWKSIFAPIEGYIWIRWDEEKGNKEEKAIYRASSNKY